ncbi:MAG: hypothetical protein ACOC2M_02395 [bacterium]
MALNPNVRNIFRNAFEQKCFQLINEAYLSSLNEKVIQLNWNENDISQEILEKIERNTLRLKWNITASREFYLPNNDFKSKGFADKLSRIDFRLTNIFAEQEFKYFIEAKRLKENDSELKRAYINEGMERFISKKYPIGCMLGYLLEGNIGKTIKGINKLLVKDKRKTETLIFKKHIQFNAYYESNHSKIGILKHIIFDFTSISS